MKDEVDGSNALLALGVILTVLIMLVLLFVVVFKP